MGKLIKIGKVAAVNLVVLLILLAVIEAGLFFLLRDPSGLKSKGPLASLFLRYHLNYERKIVQFLPECARYDDGLTYTLKPGECRFANREFDTLFSINSLGVRDDEESLAAPEIAVVGDSYAMGWGVEQEETYAQILEQQTGRSVLNNGIASYGTVRELKILERVNLENLHSLIIQYCENDFVENRAFVDNNNTLPITARAKYEKVVEKHRQKTRGYRFGLYFYELQKMVVNGLIKKIRAPFMPEEPDAQEEGLKEAEAFVHVLKQAKIDLTGVKIVVFELNARGMNDTYFIDALKAKITEPGQPEFIKNIVVLDAAKVLDNSLYYYWDDHITAPGHRVVADMLIERLGL